MSSCYVNSKVEEQRSCDHAFMGTTHALSAVAIFLIITAFFPEHVYKALGASSIWIILLASVNFAGSSLTPDLDNTMSTSKSSLGLLGDFLSMVFRGSSAVIQTTIRMPRDDSSPNPHRGFYHTIVGAFLVGFLVFLGTKTNLFELSLPAIGKMTSGAFFALIVSWLNLHMALAGLARDFIRSLKKAGGIFGETIVFSLSFIIVFFLFTKIPAENSSDFWWLGISVAGGMIVHQLGDTFTTAGCPIFFPIPRKGKLWYTYRLTKIRAGGVVEQYVFVPFFLVLVIIAFVKVAGFI